jgi:hypothetical protein
MMSSTSFHEWKSATNGHNLFLQLCQNNSYIIKININSKGSDKETSNIVRKHALPINCLSLNDYSWSYTLLTWGHTKECKLGVIYMLYYLKHGLKLFLDQIVLFTHFLQSILAPTNIIEGKTITRALISYPHTIVKYQLNDITFMTK